MWLASGENSTRQIIAEPGGIHLGQQEDNKGEEEGLMEEIEGPIRRKDKLQSKEKNKILVRCILLLGITVASRNLQV